MYSIYIISCFILAILIFPAFNFEDSRTIALRQ